MHSNTTNNTEHCTTQCTHTPLHYAPNNTHDCDTYQKKADDSGHQPREGPDIVVDGCHYLSTTIRTHSLDGRLPVLLHHRRRDNGLLDNRLCRPKTWWMTSAPVCIVWGHIHKRLGNGTINRENWVRLHIYPHIRGNEGHYLPVCEQKQKHRHIVIQRLLCWHLSDKPSIRIILLLQRFPILVFSNMPNYSTIN